ncbi:DUF6362 family protein [Oceanibaculum pacificum]|uniref:DUF6362 domain-containing protein n=1 Tax=Oceanibaculum pacificum TaxID=580166 RepID=A0A154WG88_9PROT|nr:DUF6362 family protein [Oceanibaculum pacificum]KZD12527.1 hypothetical protein AUP43_16065 [Oceanibaculum pacificum]
MTAPLWTPEAVKARLAEAAEALRRLPSARLKARLSAWPDVVQSSAEAYGYDSAGMRPAAPGPAAISRMDETLGWLFWLEAGARRILWARAMGVPWRRLEDMDGRSHVTLKRVQDKALATLAMRLNDHTNTKIGPAVLHPGNT